MVTVPSSSMSIMAPVASWMPLMVLPPGPIKSADLLRVDLRAQQPRRRVRDLASRPRDRREHLPQDLDAGLARLVQRGPDDLLVDAVDLEVELDAGDAVCVPATLKSMSPKWSSSPMMSVSRTNLSSASLTRPIEMPATGSVIGTPASISPSVPPQTVAIELEPLDSRMSETTRIVYGKLVGIGHDRLDAALGQRAVADLAPAGAADRPHSPTRERREVVVEHELLAVLVDQAVDALLVAAGAERRW